MAEDICALCGAVDEATELQECKVRDEPARVCLRCLADLQPYMLAGESPSTGGSDG